MAIRVVPGNTRPRGVDERGPLTSTKATPAHAPPPTTTSSPVQTSNTVADAQDAWEGAPSSSSRKHVATHEDLGADFGAVVAGLEEGARHENVLHALRALSHMGGAVGKAADAVIKNNVAITPPASRDLDGLRRVVGAAVSAVAGDAVGTQASARLQGALTAFRAGAVRPVIFSVEPVAFPASLPPPPKLQPSVGFEAGVEGLHLDDEHSIHDLQHYVDQRFGRFALTDLIDNGRTIELHHGSRDEAMSSLQARGFTTAVRVRTPEAVLHNELYLFQNTQTGELRYVVTEIWGGTRLGHLQKLLKACALQTPRVSSAWRRRKSSCTPKPCAARKRSTAGRRGRCWRRGRCRRRWWWVLRPASSKSSAAAPPPPRGSSTSSAPWAKTPWPPCAPAPTTVALPVRPCTRPSTGSARPPPSWARSPATSFAARRGCRSSQR